MYCGAPANTAAVQNPGQPRAGVNIFGIIGFAVSCVAFFLSFSVFLSVTAAIITAFVLSALALAFSIVGMKRRKISRLNGFAVAGLVISIVVLVFLILVAGIVLLVLFGIIFGLGN